MRSFAPSLETPHTRYTNLTIEGQLTLWTVARDGSTGDGHTGDGHTSDGSTGDGNTGVVTGVVDTAAAGGSCAGT